MRRRFEGSSPLFLGRRSSLLQNEAYAQQFQSAAGYHPESISNSSLRVYSERDRLYAPCHSLHLFERIAIERIERMDKMDKE